MKRQMMPQSIPINGINTIEISFFVVLVVTMFHFITVILAFIISTRIYNDRVVEINMTRVPTIADYNQLQNLQTITFVSILFAAHVFGVALTICLRGCVGGLEY